MSRSLREILRRIWLNLSLLDVSVLFFLVYFNLRLAWAPESADARFSRWVFLGALSLSSLSALLARGEVLKHPRARGMVHRFTLLLSVLGLYLVSMRQALAALQPTLLDDQLIRLDQALFGGVPAQLLESLVTPARTEWFAFFYFSYFLIVATATIPSAFFGRSKLPRGLVLGSVLIVCVGHILYTLVPGRGPYVALTFERELTGGLFWGLVTQAVVAKGALLDIFPSLHTAIPAFITMYLGLHRSEWPAKTSRGRALCLLLWGALVFFTINIIIATLYLRWHYAVDVVVGLALATLTVWVATRYNPSDEARAAQGRQPIFEPCLGMATASPHTTSDRLTHSSSIAHPDTDE